MLQLVRRGQPGLATATDAGREEVTVHLSFALRLPVEARSVPVVRALCRDNLVALRVDRASVDDIALAVTEACANVINHAEGGEDYEVRVDVDDAWCRISIVDTGAGFDPAATRATGTGSLLEHGRGIELMRTLVDRLHFAPAEGAGTLVRLEKRLALHEDSPLRALPVPRGAD